MRVTGIFEAKQNFSELIAAVESGEEVRITRHGKEVVRMLPVRRKPVITPDQIERELAAIHELHGRIKPGPDWRALRDEGREVTAFVLDASITARWLLPDEHGPAAAAAYAKLRAGTVDAHAPELWLWECGNIIASGVKRGRLTPPDAMLLWSVLDAVRTRVELATFEPPQVRACLVLAIDRGLSIYDAAYLWLAKSLKLPLLTDDARLADACRPEAVAWLRLEDVA